MSNTNLKLQLLKNAMQALKMHLDSQAIKNAYPFETQDVNNAIIAVFNNPIKTNFRNLAKASSALANAISYRQYDTQALNKFTETALALA